ncbi:MAG: oxidoreductase [Myxococcaceae bacterium]|nr:oxidoreductase [Myxococcaceae bacterium]
MEIVLVMGYPASGKSTWTAQHFANHRRINRDALGDRSLDELVPLVERALDEGQPAVLDNTYATRQSRAALLDLARRRGVPARCVWLDSSIEHAQYNAVERLVRKHGRLLSPDEIKQAGKADPNTYGPAVLFKHRKAFEAPTAAEGFASIEKVAFVRGAQPEGYGHKALLLDYDGTLRRTKSGDKYPLTPEDVEVLPGRAETLRRYAAEGYRLLGVSNQSAVSKGTLTEAGARACFARTNELLGVDVEVAFCPHDPAPISCWCRKPMPGLGVAFIEKYRLDRAQVTMVGDMTSDRTFAARAGVRFVDQADFFR